MRALIASLFIFETLFAPLAMGEGADKFNPMEECMRHDKLLAVFLHHKSDDPESYAMIRKQYEENGHDCKALREEAFYSRCKSIHAIRHDGAGWEDCDGIDCTPIRKDPVRRVTEERIEYEPQEPVRRSHRSTYYHDDEGGGCCGNGRGGGGIFGGGGGGGFNGNMLMAGGVGLGIGVILGSILSGNRRQGPQYPGVFMPPPGMMPPPMGMPPGMPFGGGLASPMGWGGRPSLPYSYPAPGGGAGGPYRPFNSYGFGGGYGAVNGYSAGGYGGYNLGTNTTFPQFQSPIYNGGPAPMFAPYH